MNTIVSVKTYEEPPFDRQEILRYAGCREADAEIAALLEGCIREVKGKLTYRVCWRILPVRIEEDRCDFSLLSVRSQNLAANLKDCQSAVLFAATVGVEMDRLIARYSRLSPAKALLMQAIGAERVEALCEIFCAEIGVNRPRFSPGYGDLPLSCQKEILAVLDGGRQIGLTLTDSLLMSPSKSVTAFGGK